MGPNPDGVQVIVKEPGLVGTALHLVAARIPVLRVQVALEGHGNPGSVDVDAEHDGAFPVFPGFGAVDVENQAKGCFG